MAWNSNDIRKDLKIIENIYNNESNPSERIYLSSLIDSLYGFISELDYANISSGIKIEYSQVLSSISEYNLYYPFIEKYKNVCKHNKKVFDNHITYIQNYKLYKRDLLNLVDEFYKSVGGIIYDTFRNTLNNSNINYLNSRSIESGNVFSVPILNKHYINICDTDKNRDKLITLTHEFGHSIISDIDRKRYKGYDDLVEIESTFFELLSYDFYMNILNDKYFFEAQKGNIDYYYTISNQILETRDIIMGIFNNKKFNRKSAQDTFLDILDSDLGDNISLCISSDCRYLTSYIIAIELYEVYKVDKNKAIQKLLNIISNENFTDEYSRIINNVEPNKCLGKYIRRFR